MHILTIALFAVLATAPAVAAEVAGVKLEDKASVGGQELVLNGAGVRTRAIFKVYVGSLYLPAKTANPQSALTAAPRRIQLNLLRALSADQLVDALVEGLKANAAPQELDAANGQTAELVAIMKALGDVKEKDVVTIDFADGATRIALNGAGKGVIAGDAFNRALTKVWLGENPVQADLKKAMLGG